MGLRIQFDDMTAGSVPADSAAPPQVAPSRRPLIADPHWERESAEALMLFISEEPRIGLEFRYNGLLWKIVEYRNGWIAALLVD